MAEPEELLAEAERRVERLEYENMRLRWELRQKWDLIEDAIENARTFRQMYETAARRLGIFYPDLAEITEDDAFQLWEWRVTG